MAGQLCVTAPVLLVWLVGAVLAVSQLSERRRTARLVLAALALMGFNAVVVGPLGMFVPTLLLERGMATSTIGAAMMVVGAGRAATHALAWALVLAAVFLGERPADPAP